MISIAIYALIVAAWCLYMGSIAGGYRVDPDTAKQGTQEWRDLAVAITASLLAYAMIAFWKDVIMASLSLTPSGYSWVQRLVMFMVLVAALLLLRRRTSRLPTIPQD